MPVRGGFVRVLFRSGIATDLRDLIIQTRVTKLDQCRLHRECYIIHVVSLVGTVVVEVVDGGGEQEQEQVVLAVAVAVAVGVAVPVPVAVQ